MALDAAAIPVTVGFVPASVAVPDVERPGLLRAGPRASAPYARENVERHVVAATDTCQQVNDRRVTAGHDESQHETGNDDSDRPELVEFGFDTVDLSGLATLQQVCARVREAGEIGDDDAATIRSSLQGATLACAGGRTITVLHLADEGFIMRKAGPNAMAVVGPRSRGMNEHGGATSVHADQDVFGTPLVQLMDGRAPSLLRHESPDGANRDAGLMLVNLWIPLQQITQPLVLADGRSLDRRRHQLRYGLATDTFLERDDDMAVNDIWTFLHHPDQRWYVRSEMDHRSAYVFNTLSTAHGACTLPGEDVAEQCYRALEQAEQAIASGDAAAWSDAVRPVRHPEIPAETPPALRDAIEAMAAVARAIPAEAHADAIEAMVAVAAEDHTAAESDLSGAGGDGAEAWLTRSREARRRVVRMSLEMRMVVSLDES